MIKENQFIRMYKSSDRVAVKIADFCNRNNIKKENIVFCNIQFNNIRDKDTPLEEGVLIYEVEDEII